MVSRTTDDYQQMALTGCVAISEPAFWAGWDRYRADSFEDYFRQLTEFEPRRAALYGIQHYTWLCLNPKEGEEPRARARGSPPHSQIPGPPERARHRRNRHEPRDSQRDGDIPDHVFMALDHNQLILIHTPHLEDKYKGTRVTIDSLLKFRSLDPARVMIDHAEEHTVA